MSSLLSIPRRWSAAFQLGFNPVRSVTSYGIIILKPSITLSHTIYIQCDFWICKRYRLSAPPPLFKSVCCVSGRLGVPAVVESSWVWICSYWILRYRKLQRFMIYVHAKGMIVDDEYVLMGSANTNQRSVAEHLGKTGDEFVDPADLECVNEIAEGILRAASFPDVGGKIIGAHSMALPDTPTT
ncbi:hypothetical protein F2Q69_00021378 [Brassica cretica]|uniref:phospholipase D n=1 Tax=Brassica cretica TaxID=69181 RepID=A0A8S9Q5J6_BRACR|nr:hypothetical protein F2Q69_00021378 [Brassica cretica]